MLQKTELQDGSHWTARLAVQGHTGWSEPIIYAFDQMQRLALVRAMVASAFPHGGSALDFGCGTGDFSKLLLSLGFAVCGCDPFVRPAIASPNFTFVRAARDLDPVRHRFDIILCVTVLDHILDPAELHATLQALRACLDRDGKLIMLEYALDAANDRERLGLGNEYQAFHTLTEWEEILRPHTLRIARVTPAPHPVFMPPPGYAAYLRTVLVRLLWRARKLPLPRGWRDRMLQRKAEQFAGIESGGRQGEASPLKFLECVPE